MSHTLDILRGQLKAHQEELHKFERYKQHHLTEMRRFGGLQIQVQEIIDDLHKTIMSMEKDLEQS